LHCRQSLISYVLSDTLYNVHAKVQLTKGRTSNYIYMKVDMSGFIHPDSILCTLIRCGLLITDLSSFYMAAFLYILVFSDKI